MFRNKKILAEARPNLVNNNVKKIFLNENLTPRNKKKISSCEQNNWKFVWTANGMVFLKKTETSDAVPVKNLVDLKNNLLIENYFYLFIKNIKYDVY